MLSLPRGTKLTPTGERALRQWARRNPEAARSFNRLTAAQKTNVLSVVAATQSTRGLSPIVRLSDAQRREAVRLRSQERRAYRRVVTASRPARVEALARRMIGYYGMSPQYAANLRANLARITDAELARLEGTSNDEMRRIVATQLPDGAPRSFHYHTRGR